MLGFRIAIMRQKAGLSQAALAAKVHVSTSTIGMYEQGRREPAMSILVRIAQELHVSTDFLLNTATEKTDGRENGASVCISQTSMTANQLKDSSRLLTREELAVLCMACLL